MTKLQFKIILPFLIASIIGLIIGFDTMIKYLYSNEHMSFMALAPLTIVNYLPMNIWTGLVIIIFYLGICTLPVYLNRYFLPKYFKSKYCLILAIIITVSIFIILTQLGFCVVGHNIIRGIGAGAGEYYRSLK